jgi:hypothetical protein
MAVSERSLSYQDALKEGLALPKYVQGNDPFNALSAQYWKTLGEGSMSAGQKVISQNAIKPEEFWRSTFDSYTKKWMPTSKKNTIENIEKQTKAIQEKTGREVGSQKATTKRAARAASGMLSGSQSPSMGASSSGPMLGDDTMLGQSSMLGSRRRM